mmetsp:Transcript_4156/g.5549  ORF Transcript_4156/g.5549 Transcript_4156/m.5549 type:complete len:315 (+) Transcript_4156:25-969(+)
MMLYFLLTIPITTAVWQGEVLSPEIITEIRMPTAYLLGGQKCGSTSIFDNLEHWPAEQLCSGKTIGNEAFFFKKEKHFFDHFTTTADVMKNVEMYSKHYERCDRNSVLIDGTPNYLCDTSIPKVMREVYEKLNLDPYSLKFVAIFRSPVTRAVSNYEHGVRNSWSGYINKTWENIVEEGFSGWEKRLSVTKDGELPQTYCTPLEASLYAVQIKHWMQHFKPSQFLFMSFQQLKQDPQGIMDAIATHLGLPQKTEFSRLTKANVGVYDAPHVAEDVLDFFKPHNEELFAFKTNHSECFYDPEDNKFRFEKDLTTQ